MSYSYIKSVFPNFETSKVYGEDLYNNIKTNDVNKTNETTIQEPKSFLEDKYNGETLKSVSAPLTDSTNKLINEPAQKDNLKFYNIPYIPIQNIPQTTQPLQHSIDLENQNNKEKLIEKFESYDDKLEHNKYILHVMDCKRCREALMKQLNIMDDKIKMEGYMELASYVIFGIFILLLIDTVNKR